MKLRRLMGIILGLAVGLAWASGLQAAPVGHFSQVEGRVDLLKGGNLPAVPAKVQDGLEVGDVVRTKSLSRALIKFVDDTILEIAPESRVGIEEYMFDASKGQRRAVLQVLRGLVHTLVTRVIETQQPDFLMKTHTSVLGVRGTGWYADLTPNNTDVYSESGRLSVRNISPEVVGEVMMYGRQLCRIGKGLVPTPPVDITQEDLDLLKKRFSIQGAAAGAPEGPPGLPFTEFGGALYLAPRLLQEWLGAEARPGPPVGPSVQDFGLRGNVLDLAGGLYVPPTLHRIFRQRPGVDSLFGGTFRGPLGEGPGAFGLVSPTGPGSFKSTGR